MQTMYNFHWMIPLGAKTKKHFVVIFVETIDILKNYINFFPFSVTRGCYTKDTKEVGTCKKSGDIEQCICDGDFCNSADSLSVKFSIISSMLIYLLLIR